MFQFREDQRSQERAFWAGQAGKSSGRPHSVQLNTATWTDRAQGQPKISFYCVNVCTLKNWGVVCLLYFCELAQTCCFKTVTWHRYPFCNYLNSESFILNAVKLPCMWTVSNLNFKFYTSFNQSFFLFVCINAWIWVSFMKKATFWTKGWENSVLDHTPTVH